MEGETAAPPSAAPAPSSACAKRTAPRAFRRPLTELAGVWSWHPPHAAGLGLTAEAEVGRESVPYVRTLRTPSGPQQCQSPSSSTGSTSCGDTSQPADQPKPHDVLCRM